MYIDIVNVQTQKVSIHCETEWGFKVVEKLKQYSKLWNGSQLRLVDNLVFHALSGMFQAF